MRTEPAAIIALVVAFIVGGIGALGANGSLAPELADALAVLIVAASGLITRSIVTSPATAAKLRAAVDDAAGS